MARLVGLALMVAGVTVLAAVTMAAAGPADPPTLEITMRYSRFTPGVLRVPAGVPVTIVLRNEDPIDHEWIAGDAAVHAAHRTGTELAHEERPSEVSVAALSTKTTTVVFDAPSRLAFVCHLPGHEAYGMVGTLTVVH